MKNLGFAKYKEYDTVWEIIYDNEDGTVDLFIDDLQGDMTVCYAPKTDITLLEEKDYIEKIKSLKEKL